MRSCFCLECWFESLWLLEMGLRVLYLVVDCDDDEDVCKYDGDKD